MLYYCVHMATTNHSRVSRVPAQSRAPARVLDLGDKPRIRPLGLPPIQGCQEVILDGQQYNIPFGFGPEAFENFMADVDDEPTLSGWYTWHCSKQVPYGNSIVVCGHENRAPRFLLDGDSCGGTASLPCEQCHHVGLSVKKCQYPDCWWNYFQVLGHKEKDFCIFHTSNDPENIMDVITKSIQYQDSTGQVVVAGGQSFLDECDNLDDYDAELDWFMGQETDLNHLQTI